MGIYKNGKPIMYIRYNGEEIFAVYVGEHKVWPGIIEAIPSCYASGYWQDQYAWTEDTPWKD